MTSARTYGLVWLVLMALGALSFGLSYLPLGDLQTPVALAIAAVKAVLVILFFMHVLEQKGTMWMYLVLAVLLLSTLVALMALDIDSRETQSPVPNATQGS